MAMFNSYVKLPEGTPIKKHQRSGCFTGPPSTHLLANFLRGPLAAIHEPIAPCSRRFFGSSRSRGRGGVDPMSYFTFDDFWKVTRLEIGVDHQNSASFQFPNFDDWKKVNLNGLHIDVCEKNTTGKTCKTIRNCIYQQFWKTKFSSNHTLQRQHIESWATNPSLNVDTKTTAGKTVPPCDWKHVVVEDLHTSLHFDDHFFAIRVLQNKIALSRDYSVSNCCGVVLLVSKKQSFLSLFLQPKK